jgi:predicted Rossmann-fold nucleotide-binding protein
MTQIFVSGTWRDDKAMPYADQAKALGRRLAERKFDLACGPGTGISRYVIDGYRSVSPRGEVRFYLPAEEHMLAVGEEVAHGADHIEQTQYDYPMRNVYQISKSDGVFILTGGDGTLEEALPALIDYNLPVGVIDNSGKAAAGLRALLNVFPEWNKLLIFSADVDSIIDPYCDLVIDFAAKRPCHSKSLDLWRITSEVGVISSSIQCTRTLPRLGRSPTSLICLRMYGSTSGEGARYVEGFASASAIPASTQTLEGFVISPGTHRTNLRHLASAGTFSSNAKPGESKSVRLATPRAPQ